MTNDRKISLYYGTAVEEKLKHFRCTEEFTYNQTVFSVHTTIHLGLIEDAMYCIIILQEKSVQ